MFWFLAFSDVLMGGIFHIDGSRSVRTVTEQWRRYHRYAWFPLLEGPRFWVEMASGGGWVILFVTTEHPSFSSTTSINGFSDRYDWPFWKTNSPRKCASTPTAPSFPHCAYLSVEAYTISNWPDLAFRVPLIEWLWLLSVAALPTSQKRQLFKTVINRSKYNWYHSLPLKLDIPSVLNMLQNHTVIIRKVSSPCVFAATFWHPKSGNSVRGALSTHISWRLSRAERQTVVAELHSKREGVQSGAKERSTKV